MGRSALAKQMAENESKEGWARSIASGAREHARQRVEKDAEDSKRVLTSVEPYLGKAWRGVEGFKPKTRSARLEKRALELARWLFGKHPVPRILWQAWEAAAEPARGWAGNPAARAGGDARAWFVAVGSGESFAKTCAKGLLTRKEAHLFLGCPHAELSIAEALVWCVCRARGGSDGVALRVARSKIARMDFNDFWRDAARFFADHPPASVAECGDMCDYLADRLRREAGFKVFGNGFTAESLRARVDGWHRDLAREKALGSASWDGADMEGSCYWREVAEGARVCWSFSQIKDAKALAAEGNAMRHCVLSYKQACVSGRCSIWSLKAGWGEGAGDRKLTVELDAGGRVVQARGLANRMPRSEEMWALRQWARDKGLDLGRLE
jgi:hypothetical protein